MILKLKENVLYKSFKNQKDLKEFIIDMILESKTDKILFKGYPYDLNYKQLKKIMDYDNRLGWSPEQFKKHYQDIVDMCDESYCCIFKEKV